MAQRSSRPYPTHTKLGRVLDSRGLRAIQLTMEAKIHPRSVTEFLAGRVQPSNQKMIAICTWLKVPASALLEDYYPWLAEDQAAKVARVQAANEQKERVA